MIILVLNCGSSSVKYQLFRMGKEQEDVIAVGMVERIGFTDAVISHKPAGKTKHKEILPIMDHTMGINLIMKAMVDKEHGVLKSIEEIAAVGHRVVQGGEILITPFVLGSRDWNSRVFEAVAKGEGRFFCPKENVSKPR